MYLDFSNFLTNKSIAVDYLFSRNEKTVDDSRVLSEHLSSDSPVNPFEIGYTQIFSTLDYSELNSFSRINRHHRMNKQRRAYKGIGRKLNPEDIGKAVQRTYPLQISAAKYDWSFMNNSRIIRDITSTEIILENGFSLGKEYNDGNWLTVEEFERYLKEANLEEGSSSPVAEPRKVPIDPKWNEISSSLLQRSWIDRVKRRLPKHPGTADYSFRPPETFSAPAPKIAKDTDSLEILGLNRTATKKEIQKRFRDLALKLHPDKGGDEEAYKKIQKATQKLLDELSTDEPGIFLFDPQLSPESNFCEAKQFIRAYLDKTPFSLKELQAEIPPLEQLVEQLKRIEEQPTFDQALKKSLTEAIGAARAVLFFYKLKQTVFLMKLPETDQETAEYKTQLNRLVFDFDLSNNRNNWSSEGLKLHIANLLILDKYLALQRTLVERFASEGNTDPLIKLREEADHFSKTTEKRILLGSENMRKMHPPEYPDLRADAPLPKVPRFSGTELEDPNPPKESESHQNKGSFLKSEIGRLKENIGKQKTFFEINKLSFLKI